MVKIGDKASSKPWLRVVGIVKHSTLNFHQDPDDHGDPVAFAFLPHEPEGFWRLVARERAGTLMTKILYDVHPTDVAAIVTAEVILLAVTMLASMVPAIRAMRADPVVALRAT